METISIELIWAVASLVLFCGWIYWITKPDKCPVCGEKMNYYYTNKNNNPHLECPKCGYNEKSTNEKVDCEEP